MDMLQPHPRLAILGSGPTGLEAALAAADQGWPFTVYEAADHTAAHVRAWGHVRLFTPWSMNVSDRMARHLAAADLPVPEGDDCPVGDELCDRLLDPLAALPEVAPAIRYDARVTSVGRRGLLKHEEIATASRGGQPFRLLVSSSDGHEELHEADVVLDCTGTYSHPNSTGDGGIPAAGERGLGDRIHRTVPDVSAEAGEWAGQTVLVVGAGHSAQTAAADLAAFARSHPGTEVVWAVRSTDPTWGEVAEDTLPQRAALV
ncbi:MAG TPA: FAD-dependent oxidoreductase, partial [Acidimicrobiales bacterium]|nr:FAD-dependent oxidoreductase [Acidimicrobiales bacterium]